MDVSILGIAGYIPGYAIKRKTIAEAWGSRASGEKSVVGSDEDAVTMGVAAAEKALQQVALAGEQIDAFFLASTSAPYQEYSPLEVVKEVLGMAPEADAVDVGGSARAMVAALKAAMDGIASGRLRRSLVVGADCQAGAPGSQLDMELGAGASALLVGDGEGLARIEAIHTYSKFAIDRWRAADQPYVQDNEPRFASEAGYVAAVTEAGRGLLGKLQRTVGDYQHVVFQQPNKRAWQQAARALQVSVQQIRAPQLFDEVGDVGAACLGLGLMAALEVARPGDKILGLAYGAGFADAISLEVGKGITGGADHYLPEKRQYLNYPAYLRYQGTLQSSAEKLKLALPPASPFMWRSGRELYRLIGARCAKCGYLNFPPSLHSICVRCGSTELAETNMSRRGKVHTYTINHVLPEPLEVPLVQIIADMDDGGRYMAMGTDISPEEIKIGLPVELVVRRLAKERGISVYAYKFRPVRAGMREINGLE